MRAHPEPIGYSAAIPRTPVVQPAYAAPTVLFVVPEAQRILYTGDSFTRVYTHTNGDAIRMLASHRPRAVVIDWDDSSLGAAELCAAARTAPNVSVLVTTGRVENAAAILKAGCHGVLLKPFVPNLLAARLSRVIKETERLWGHKTVAAGWQTGTNRVWPETACPKCGAPGATSFDFSSYRRMWYACLACDHTWLGPRQE